MRQKNLQHCMLYLLNLVWLSRAHWPMPCRELSVKTGSSCWHQPFCHWGVIGRCPCVRRMMPWYILFCQPFLFSSIIWHRTLEVGKCHSGLVKLVLILTSGQFITLPPGPMCVRTIEFHQTYMTFLYPCFNSIPCTMHILEICKYTCWFHFNHLNIQGGLTELYSENLSI